MGVGPCRGTCPIGQPVSGERLLQHLAVFASVTEPELSQRLQQFGGGGAAFFFVLTAGCSPLAVLVQDASVSGQSRLRDPA